MAANYLFVEIRLAWWWTWLYLPGLRTMLWLAETLNIEAEPDMQKVGRILKKAVRVGDVKSRG